MIYQEAIPERRRQPTPSDIQAIYLENNKATWKDQASPLLFLCKQIHDEFSDTSKNSELCLKVTGQGIILDEAAPIAPNACRDLNRISHLRIDVWPPHPHRRYEIARIWLGLKRLERLICNCSQLQRLIVTFADNGDFCWIDDGGSQDPDPCYQASGAWKAARLKDLLDAFSSVTNIKHVEVLFETGGPIYGGSVR
ncbi:MAG: hypothetical protein Q9221_007961 [Calogaya cf. arnoldii]